MSWLNCPPRDSRSHPRAGPSRQSSPDPEAPVYRLPKTSAAIRAALRKYGGAVFPKLNWTSPRVGSSSRASPTNTSQDAAFLLPQTEFGPLHCISPDDVYLLLKSSDFIQHDLDAERAYEGCVGAENPPEPRIELVLKKFVELNPAREVRCFVRDNILLGEWDARWTTGAKLARFEWHDPIDGRHMGPKPPLTPAPSRIPARHKLLRPSPGPRSAAEARGQCTRVLGGRGTGRLCRRR